jgi:hypothetical protein
MDILTGEKITFKEIERSFFEIGCEISKILMQCFLEKVDKELAESRNKAEFRHKGHRATTIKTLMGEISYSRTLCIKESEMMEV